MLKLDIILQNSNNLLWNKILKQLIFASFPRHAMKCQEEGKNGFPLWTEIAISISHLLLVVNSSTNIFVYCFLSSPFRAECAKLYQSVCRKIFRQA